MAGCVALPWIVRSDSSIMASYPGPASTHPNVQYQSLGIPQYDCVHTDSCSPLCSSAARPARQSWGRLLYYVGCGTKRHYVALEHSCACQSGLQFKNPSSNVVIAHLCSHRDPQDQNPATDCYARPTRATQAGRPRSQRTAASSRSHCNPHNPRRSKHMVSGHGASQHERTLCQP